MGMRIGYARVSSSGQKLDIQMDRLADCEKIFSEKASGRTAKDRPELQKALDYVRDNDVFVVTKLDRLARWSRRMTHLMLPPWSAAKGLLLARAGQSRTPPVGQIRTPNDASRYACLPAESAGDYAVDRQGSGTAQEQQQGEA